MPPNTPDFDILQEIMTQLREISRKVDAQATKEDLKEYVLRAVYEVEIGNLKIRDEAQQRQIDEARERELTQGQRLLTFLGGACGLIAAVITIISHFH